MTIEEKYKDQSITELSSLFFEVGNQSLVPELSNQITIALEKFKKLQDDNEELSEMIIIADIDEKLFAFAVGDGSDIESKEDEAVFYIAKSEQFNECMELLDYVCFDNHPNGHLSLDSEVYHWIGDAMPDIDIPVTIYGNYFYGESDVDPMYEG